MKQGTPIAEIKDEVDSYKGPWRPLETLHYTRTAVDNLIKGTLGIAGILRGRVGLIKWQFQDQAKDFEVIITIDWCYFIPIMAYPT